jgi:hypothetical protein
MWRRLLALCGGAALVLVGAGFGGMSPAARVLEIKGKATVSDSENSGRLVAVFGTIYADEQIVAAKDSQVTLVFRGDGHVERIVAPGTYKITATGCQPKTGVEQVAMSEQNRATIGKISQGRRGVVQGGVVVARAAPPLKTSAPAEPPATSMPNFVPHVESETLQIRPIVGVTVLDAKPTFSWPAIAKAKTYTLNLYLQGNRVWSAETEKAQLPYASDSPLKAGWLYSWEVITTVDDKPSTVCEGEFQVATDRQRADVAGLQKLLAKPEPLYLALAAMWYKQNGLVDEAIAANEQLAKLAPDAAVYRELSTLYFMAGREKDADAADAKAAELEKVMP